MRRRNTAVIALVSALCTALGAGDALAQGASSWVRPGPCRTRDACLVAPTAVDSEPVRADVDHDGTDEEFVVLARDEDTVPAVARRSPAGWSFTLVDNESSPNRLTWAEAVTLPTGVLARLDYEGRNDGAENVRGSTVYWFPAQGPRREVSSVDGVEMRTFSALPDGSLQQCEQRRCRPVTFNQALTQLVFGAWVMRSAPALPTGALRAGCTAHPGASFHLRPTEALAARGPEYGVGNVLQVLAATGTTRGAARLYRVRLGSGPTGDEGYVFLVATDMDRSCSP